MPYIPQDQRGDLDPHIDALLEALRRNPDAAAGSYEGALNYTITRLVEGIMPELRYRHLARVTGVLENVKQELYRRVAAPYEDGMISRHGDVYKNR